MCRLLCGGFGRFGLSLRDNLRRIRKHTDGEIDIGGVGAGAEQARCAAEAFLLEVK